MVFAVQCPNPKCRKFMLVEDQVRIEGQVKCLICRTDIKIADAKAGQSTPPPVRRPQS